VILDLEEDGEEDDQRMLEKFEELTRLLSLGPGQHGGAFHVERS